MTLLAPVALLLGFLALPILLLYMLKLRRKEVEVSSTMLWEMLLRDRQANTPWQKLRRSILLLLQLVILLGLVISLARPGIAVPSISSASVILLLDASASMNASDIDPSRFDQARQQARLLADDLGSGKTMTIILVAEQPEVVVSNESDPRQVSQALQPLSPALGTADWESAFALAAGIASSSATGDPATIIILSDGGLPDQDLPPLPGKVVYLPVGVSGDNLAISALSLRSTGEAVELFARITNYADTGQSAIFSLYREGELLTAQNVSLPARQSRAISMAGLPDSQATYEGRLSRRADEAAYNDYLPLDDAAYAVYHPPQTRRALLVSEGNIFLEQVLAAMPGIQAYRAMPAEDGSLQLPPNPFDLYIFDRLFPPAEQIPTGNLLLIDPPENPFFAVTGGYTVTGELHLAEHPLARYLDLSSVYIAHARSVILPAWAEEIVSTDASPLVFAGETGGRRLAVLAFSLSESDLPLQVAFPILFSNMIDYLLPARWLDAPDGLHPGETLQLSPLSSVNQVMVISPSGKTYPLPLQENGYTFANTDETGLYQVNYLQGEQAVRDNFAVNLFSETEADIHLRHELHIGQITIQSSPKDQISLQELWPWLAGCSLVLLLVEWWVYHRQSLFSLTHKISNLKGAQSK